MLMVAIVIATTTFRIMEGTKENILMGVILITPIILAITRRIRLATIVERKVISRENAKIERNKRKKATILIVQIWLKNKQMHLLL